MLTRFWLRLAELSLTLLLAAAVILAWREARQDRAQLQSQLAAANQALAAATNRQQDRDAQLATTLTAIAAQKKSATTPAQWLAGIAREMALPAPLTLVPSPATAAAGNYAASTNPAASPAANQAANPVGNPAGKSPLSSALPAGKSDKVQNSSAAQQPAPNSLPQSAQLSSTTDGSGGAKLTFDPRTPTGIASPSAPSPASPFPFAPGRPNNPASPAAGQIPGAKESPAAAKSQGQPGAVQIPAADLQTLYNFALDCQACQAKLTAAQADLQDERTKSATLTKSRDAALEAAKGGSLWRRTTRAAKWFALGAAAGVIAAKSHR